jgi:hypothetical protein
LNKNIDNIGGHIKMKEKKVLCICLILWALLLPVANCIQVSVNTNVGGFSEHLGADIDDAIYGSAKITRDGLFNAVYAKSALKDKSSSTGTLNLDETHSVGSNAKAGAQVGVKINRAKSYSYQYGIYSGGSFVGAAEGIDVTGAKSINAWAKAYNKALYDAGVSTTVNDGDLHGYSNLAIASIDSVGAFQMFDRATGTIKCDSTVRKLPAIYTPTVEQATSPEASVITNAVGTIADYEDSAVKTSLGTSIEQNALISGSFTSVAKSKASSLTRDSNFGNKFGLDMQAKIASGSPSVNGKLTYFINPGLDVQTAVDRSQIGDIISLAPGQYNGNVNIGKPVTVRGQGITGTITNPGAITNTAGNNYVNAREVFLRADDVGWYTPSWNWMTNLVSSTGIKATYGVVPGSLQYDDSGNAILQSVDKNSIELATHGLNHDEHFGSMAYSDQYNTILQARDLMTKLYYRPRTFITPFAEANADTITALTNLGYHTLSATPYISGATINQIGYSTMDSYEFEIWAPSGNPNHHTAAEFEQWFANSNSQNCLVVMHANTYTSQADQKEFADAMTWLKGQNVEFLTMDQAYRYGEVF